MVKTKPCTKCLKDKSFSEFGKGVGCKFDLRPECKVCKREIDRLYRLKNKEELNKQQKKKYYKARGNNGLYDRTTKIEKKIESDKKELIGLEFGSFKITKFLGRFTLGACKHKRNFYEKVCKFCGDKKRVQPHGIRSQIGKTPICILCSESVNIHTHEKRCNDCETWKPATTEYFVKSKNRRFGIHYYCKICSTKRNIKYRENPENRAKEVEYKKRRLREEPLFRFKSRVRSNVKSSLLYRGYKKNNKTSNILKCSFDEFEVWIEKQFTEGMTWENHGKWHLDHIVPLSLGYTEEEVLELCHYTNYQPLWSFDNISKNDKIMLEYISPENMVKYNKYIERGLNKLDS